MNNKSIARVVEYIEENLTEKISIEKLAQLSGLSNSHFHVRFSNITGEKVIDYIKKRRLTQASFTLLETDKPILHIAMDYGYNSQEAFSRAFKKVFKLTPKKYRDSKCDNINSIKTKLDRRRFVKDKSYEIKHIKKITLIGVENVMENDEFDKSFELYHKIYNLIVKLQYPLKEIKVYEYFKVVNYTEDINGNFSIKTKNFVGVEYNSNAEIPEGYKIFTIEDNKYAVFEHKGSAEHVSNTITEIYNERLSDLGLHSKDYSTIKVHDDRVYGFLFDRNNRIKDKYLYQSEEEYLNNLDRSEYVKFPV